MNQLNGRYFIGGFVIGLIIGVALHSMKVGVAIGLVFGGLLSVRK